MSEPRKILYAGTYERSYPRNQQLIRLLRRQGCSVIEIHEPFWERMRDKSRGFGGAVALIQLALRLIVVYLRLIVRTVPHLRSSDALFIGYIGQLDMLVLGTLGRLFRVPVVFTPLVTLTDTIVDDRALVNQASVIGKMVWLIDWLSLRIASLVITDTPENSVFLMERFGRQASRIASLFVGADEGVFTPMRWGPSPDGAQPLHVLFYGKMIPLHGVETILHAIEILHSSHDREITFEIIGSGQQQGLVESFIRDHPEARIVYRPWVAYRRLPQRIAMADCVLGVFGTGDKAGRVIPNKVFQSMAVGAPIITRDSDAVRRVLRDEQSALLIPPGDPVALADAIRSMDNRECRTKLGKEARKAFEVFASDDTLDSDVSALLEGLWGADKTHQSPEWTT